jgi:hypothetical protein
MSSAGSTANSAEQPVTRSNSSTQPSNSAEQPAETRTAPRSFAMAPLVLNSLEQLVLFPGRIGTSLASAEQPGASESSAPQPDLTVGQQHSAQDDMKEFYNTWRRDVGSWMRPSDKEYYDWCVEQGRRQEAHQLAKRKFSAYLFQLSGSFIPPE